MRQRSELARFTLQPRSNGSPRGLSGQRIKGVISSEGEAAATWQERGGLASAGSSPDARPPMLFARESRGNTRNRDAE
jgi:hypothetical protein